MKAFIKGVDRKERFINEGRFWDRLDVVEARSILNNWLEKVALPAFPPLMDIPRDLAEYGNLSRVTAGKFGSGLRTPVPGNCLPGTKPSTKRARTTIPAHGHNLTPWAPPDNKLNLG